VEFGEVDAAQHEQVVAGPEDAQDGGHDGDDYAGVVGEGRHAGRCVGVVLEVLHAC